MIDYGEYANTCPECESLDCDFIEDAEEWGEDEEGPFCVAPWECNACYHQWSEMIRIPETEPELPPSESLN